VIDRCYDFDAFMKLIKERRLRLKDLRLCFWDTVHGDLGKREAILSIPDRYNYLEINVVRECLIGYIYYNYFFYEGERKRKEEGTQTKKLKEWEKSIIDFVKEKLGFVPIEGRWIP